MAATTVSLSMDYHKRSGRWLVKTIKAPHGPALQFPDEERIQEIWHANVLGEVSFSMGNVLSGPARAFYADVGKGSRPAERQKFLEALLAESPVL